MTFFKGKNWDIKRYIKDLGIWAVCTALFFVLFFAGWKLVIRDSASKEYISQHTGESSWDEGRNRKVELAYNSGLQQTFVNDSNSLGLSVQLHDAADREVLVNVELENRTTGTIVYSGEAVAQNGVLRVDYVDDIDGVNEYCLSLVNLTEGEPVTFLVTKDDKYINGSLSIDNVSETGDLVFKVYSKQNIYRTWIYLSFIISALIALLVCVWLKKEYVAERNWKYSLFIISMIFLILFPPLTIPDEGAHIENAYRFSNMMLGKGFSAEQNQMYIRASDLDLYQLVREDSCTDHIYIRRHWDWTCDDNTILTVDARTTYKEVLMYLPCAVGMALARLLNLGCFPMLYLGRIFNFLFYFWCVTKAVAILPKGKMILMMIALLPMTIHQSVSYSYDALINGAAFLFMAVCLRKILSEDYSKYTKKDIGILIYCGLTLFVAKQHAYMFLLALLLLEMPWKKLEKKKQYLFWATVGVVVAVVAIAGVVYVDGLREVAQTTDYTGMRYSIGYILTHPVPFAKVMASTIYHNGYDYLITMIGQRLSWLNVPLHLFIVTAYMFLLFIAALMEEKTELGLNKVQKLIIVSICIMVFGCVMAGMSTTAIIGSNVAGVQGRYFTPILPLILLLCRNKRITCRVNNDSTLIKGSLILQLFVILTVIKYIFCGA